MKVLTINISNNGIPENPFVKSETLIVKKPSERNPELSETLVVMKPEVVRNPKLFSININGTLANLSGR